MFRTFTVLLISLPLVGCVNIYDYKKNSDHIGTYTTTKKPQEFAECVQYQNQHWNKMNAGGSIHSYQGKYTFMLAGSEAIDVEEVNGITTIDYYSVPRVTDFTDIVAQQKAVIKVCQ